jgi:diguanylate cyclase (GGDEF)-like protein
MDKLTGLYNDSYLTEEVRRLLSAAARIEGTADDAESDSASSVVSVMMVKPDNFKAINDTYGHEAGDETLKLMARTLQQIALPGESAVRFRGNELALLMPETDRGTARHRADEVQPAMNGIDVSPIIGTAGFSLSVSIGLASASEWHTDRGTPVAEIAETLIQTAHERAFAARESGGNAVRDWS